MSLVSTPSPFGAWLGIVLRERRSSTEFTKFTKCPHGHLAQIVYAFRKVSDGDGPLIRDLRDIRRDCLHLADLREETRTLVDRTDVRRMSRVSDLEDLRRHRRRIGRRKRRLIVLTEYFIAIC